VFYSKTEQHFAADLFHVKHHHYHGKKKLSLYCSRNYCHCIVMAECNVGSRKRTRSETGAHVADALGKKKARLNVPSWLKSAILDGTGYGHRCGGCGYAIKKIDRCAGVFVKKKRGPYTLFILIGTDACDCSLWLDQEALRETVSTEFCCEMWGWDDDISHTAAEEHKECFIEKHRYIDIPRLQERCQDLLDQDYTGIRDLSWVDGYTRMIKSFITLIDGYDDGNIKPAKRPTEPDRK